MLFRLVRGAGLAGAAGMAERAAWPVAVDGAPKVVRPLLGIERLEVEAYLAALDLEPRQDSTNQDVAYSRNRIRSRVLPELRAINPRASRTLAAFASRAAADDDALELWAETSAAAIMTVEAERVTIDRAGLRALPPAVRTRVLLRAAGHLDIAFESAHLEAAEVEIGRAHV